MAVIAGGATFKSRWEQSAGWANPGGIGGSARRMTFVQAGSGKIVAAYPAVNGEVRQQVFDLYRDFAKNGSMNSPTLTGISMTYGQVRLSYVDGRLLMLAQGYFPSITEVAVRLYENSAADGSGSWSLLSTLSVSSGLTSWDRWFGRDFGVRPGAIFKIGSTFVAYAATVEAFTTDIATQKPSIFSASDLAGPWTTRILTGAGTGGGGLAQTWTGSEAKSPHDDNWWWRFASEQNPLTPITRGAYSLNGTTWGRSDLGVASGGDNRIEVYIGSDDTYLYSFRRDFGLPGTSRLLRCSGDPAVPGNWSTFLTMPLLVDSQEHDADGVLIDGNIQISALGYVTIGSGGWTIGYVGI